MKDSSPSYDNIHSKLMKIESKLENLKRLIEIIKNQNNDKDYMCDESITSEYDSIQQSEDTLSERYTSASIGLQEDKCDFIYPQVASFISQNEQHPHFLIAIFSLLKFFDSDHLRNEALQSIKSIIEQDGKSEYETLGNESVSEKPEIKETEEEKVSCSGLETSDVFSSSDDFDELQQTAIFLEENFKRMKEVKNGPGDRKYN